MMGNSAHFSETQNKLQRQIVLTLGYCDQFAYPLTLDEIHRRLIWSLQSQSLPTKKDVLDELIILEEMGCIGAEENGGTNYYFLSLYGDKNTHIQDRLQKEEIAKSKSSEITTLVAFVAKLPWVLGVAITGSMSLSQAKIDDDIDFLLVVRKNHLWLVRPLIVWFALMHGKRRTWQREEKNSWCFNLWLEEDDLALSRNRRSLYTAYEVSQARWVYSRSGVAERFMLVNGWVQVVLPEYWRLALKSAQSIRSQTPWYVQIMESWPLVSITAALNACMYLLQRAYMRSHMTLEQVETSKAFFHPRDTMSIVRNNWQTSLRYWQLRQRWGEGCVLATGVFDLLHVEHVRFLYKAQAKALEMGKPLIIGLESDVRARQMKGEGRPVRSQIKRLSIIRALGIANDVFILPEQFSAPKDHQKIIYALRPSVLAVSSHTKHIEKKQALLSEVGGRVVIVHEHNPLISTTKLLGQT